MAKAPIRHQRIILTVEPHMTGDIIADMEGRVISFAVETIESVDGRSIIARQLRAQESSLPTPPSAGNIKPDQNIVRQKIIAHLQKHGPMKPAAVGAALGLTGNQLTYQYKMLVRAGALDNSTKGTWAAAQNAPMAEAKVSEAPTQKSTRRRPHEIEAMVQATLKLLSKFDRIKLPEILQKLGIPSEDSLQFTSVGQNLVRAGLVERDRFSGWRITKAGRAQIGKASASVGKMKVAEPKEKQTPLSAAEAERLRTRILRVLSRGKRKTAQELAESLLVSVNTVAWQGLLLAKQGLIEKDRSLGWTITKDGLKFLDKGMKAPVAQSSIQKTFKGTAKKARDERSEDRPTMSPAEGAAFRQKILNVLTTAGVPITRADIHAKTGGSSDSVAWQLKRLKSAKLVVMVGMGRWALVGDQSAVGGSDEQPVDRQPELAAAV